MATSGLMASGKRFLSTLTSIISTRLELLANELQEERLRLTQMLVLGCIALFCLAMTAILMTLFVILAFWEESRLAATGFMLLLYAAIGGFCIISIRQKAKQKRKLFSASIAELKKDRQRLLSASDEQQP